MTDQQQEQQRLDEIALSFSSLTGFNSVVVEYGFRSMAPHLHGSSCLELGSADGKMTSQLADHFDQLTVIDGSRQFAAAMRELFADNPSVTVEHSLFEQFTPKSRFDTIVAAHVFEHVDDTTAIARRALDWLNPGGRMIVIVPNAHSFNRLLGVKMGLIDEAGALTDGDVAIGHRRVYTPDELRSDLTRAGWKVATTTGVLFKPVSNAQMQQWFTPEMVEGCWLLGHDFPDNAGDILCVCERPGD